MIRSNKILTMSWPGGCKREIGEEKGRWDASLEVMMGVRWMGGDRRVLISGKARERCERIMANIHETNGKVRGK